jgi:hypothetical protein
MTDTFDLRWRETLKGRVGSALDVFEGTTLDHRSDPFRLDLTVTIPDWQRFVGFPKHRATLSGTATSALFGDRSTEVAVVDGRFQLFSPTNRDPLVRQFRYDMTFGGPNGDGWGLRSFKSVADDDGFDMWGDTTRLHVEVVHCGRGTARVVAARGTVKVSLLGFLRLLLSMRVGRKAPPVGEHKVVTWILRPFRFVGRNVWRRLCFYGFFLRQALRIYGNPFVVKGRTDQIRRERAGREIRRSLGFVPRRRVRWGSVRTLWTTGINVVRADLATSGPDPRDVAVGRPRVFSDLADCPDPVSVDYLADTGDGFSATYSVAEALSRPLLRAGGVNTQRGRLLVLGGDIVYPTPSRKGYRDRSIGALDAAFRHCGSGGAGQGPGHSSAEEEHYILAIPGNHDWYDGLRAYRSYLARKGTAVGARHVVQSDSWFAARLPGRWWIVGVDGGLKWQLNDRQRLFLTDVRKELGPRDRVVLVFARPAWLDEPGSPPRECLRELEDCLRCWLAVVVAGNSHHYARYGGRGDDVVRITCGGGGAFTSGTHHLPRRLDREFGNAMLGDNMYPNARHSQRNRWKTLYAVLMNLSSAITAGLIYLLLGGVILLDSVGRDGSVLDRVRQASWGDLPGIAADAAVVSAFGLLLLVAFATLLVAAAVAGSRGRSRVVGAVAGVLHVAAHLVALTLLTWLVAQWDIRGASGALVMALMLFVGGALVGSLVTGAYLVATDVVGIHPTAAAAVQRRTDHKSFLRLTFDPLGELAIDVYGIPRVCRYWRLRDDRDKRCAVCGGDHGSQALLVPTTCDVAARVEHIERIVVPSR